MKKIPLTQNKVAIVDDVDFEGLNQLRWCAANLGNQWYAMNSLGCGNWRKGRKPHTLMHRLILGAQKGQMIDHINGSGLDNRRENLRFCTRAQNQHNRKSTKGRKLQKGVTLRHNGKGDRWGARIKFDGRLYIIGTFDDENTAAMAYNDCAEILFGEFARLNQIKEKNKCR